MFIGLLPLIMIVLMAFWFDPLHLYTVPSDKENAMYSTDQRIQNAGYINTFDFDSVVIGNSHMENLSHRKTSEYIPGKWFNLSMSGSVNNERKLVLDKAFSEKKIKQVLLLLTGDARNRPTDGFDILYDKNPFNDVSIYFNGMYSKCFVKYFLNTVFKMDFNADCFGHKLNIDEHNSWIYSPDHNSRFGGIQQWGKYYTNVQLIDLYKEVGKLFKAPARKLKELSKEEKNEIQKDIRDNIIPLLEEHPDTIFYSYAQPCFKLTYSLALRKNNDKSVEVYIEFLKEIAQVASTHKNFHLFGFDNLPFTEDVKNYKDTSHFTRELNYQLLDYIKNGKYTLDNSNIDGYINNFIKDVYAFELDTFKENWYRESLTRAISNEAKE